MLSFYNIWTVARYEIKTLLRSWFFRIFAGLTIFILFWMDFAFMTIGDVPLNFKGLAACIPYMNILFLNTAQAVICVFLASDFLKRDKKLDTTEVVYMRSMTNGDYVMGKTLGIMTVFIALNVIMLLIGLVFNIIATDVAVKPLAYLWYPLLISVPTLIFILGLSFLSMAIIGNQAVTFILLLGYIASTLFFLGDKFHHLFDYMAFRIPMMQSDFVGFGNVFEILIHRSIYLLLGFAAIFATIRLLKRLPQSRVMHGSSGVIAIILTAGAILLGGVYTANIFSENDIRNNIVTLNDKYIKYARVTPIDYNIFLDHRGESIQCKVKVIFTNNNNTPVDKYVFSLNPGLKLQKITRSNYPVDFEQNLQIVLIDPHQNLKTGAKDSLIFHYSGSIEEAACYLDLDEELRESQYRIWMYNIAKRYAFISNDYLLLTPESNWYPTAGVTFSTKKPHTYIHNFSNFKLDVKTTPGLVAVSQGEVTGESGHFSFRSEFPLPQISLSIGNYIHKSITADSILFSLYTLKGHDYYSTYVDSIGDTLGAVITEQLHDFENKIELPFPYKRFSIVEVPIQFISYPRIWTRAGEAVQPEIVYLSENGVGVDGADFKQTASRMERWSKRSNEVVTVQQEQTKVLQRFIKSTFFEETQMFRFGDEDEPTLRNNYTVFPFFYSYVNYLQSDLWPLLNTALESHFSSRLDNTMRQMRRMWLGLTTVEKVNLALLEKNMQDLLKDPEYSDLRADIIKAKGNYLFSQLEMEIGDMEFTEFLSNLLTEYRFKALPVDELLDVIKNKYDFDFRQTLDKWETAHNLPGYLVTGLKNYSVAKGRRTKYQVKFIVTNQEKNDGIIKIEFRMGSRGRGRGMFRGDVDTVPPKLISLKAGESKELGFVLDSQPRALLINTLLSQNLPIVITQMFEDFELDKKAALFEGEKLLAEPPVLIEPGTIIVDNEDPGFEIVDVVNESPLKKLLRIKSKKKEKYVGIRSWRTPTNWSATTDAKFYGKYVKSGLYIKPGEGDKKVIWTTPLSERGNYDIYCHYPKIRNRWNRNKGSGNEGEYIYRIYHADGVDEALLDKKNAEQGWNFLGTYYLESDTAKVELTNKATSEKIQKIYADAIKWVKK